MIAQHPRHGHGFHPVITAEKAQNAAPAAMSRIKSVAGTTASRFGNGSCSATGVPIVMESPTFIIAANTMNNKTRTVADTQTGAENTRPSSEKKRTDGGIPQMRTSPVIQIIACPFIETPSP